MDLSIADIVLDEISLEGLDGITLSTLWIRLSLREPSILFTLDDDCKSYIWSNVILKNKQLEFYNLPSPRPKFICLDRFNNVDPDTGVCIELEALGDIYPVDVVKEDCSGLKGSCSTFNTRKNITNTIRLNEFDLRNIEKKYGEAFVIVASQKLRCISLYGKNNYETELYKIIFDDKIYCFLERIARSRHQGELTFGQGNINTAFHIKPANTFPLRKKLKKYHLITVQDFSLKQLETSPNSAGKLLMLSRFHKDHIPLYVNYLSNISNLLTICHQEMLPMIQVKESLNFSAEVFKKILKLGSKYMRVESRNYREFYPNAEPKEYLTKGKNTERKVKVLKLLQPYKGTMDDDEADERVQDDEDDADVDFSSANGFGMFLEESTFLSHIDQSSLSQCYKVIDAYGKEGLNGKELGRRMHFSIFDLRLIWKSLEKKACIDIVKVEEGKHRFRKLCLKKNSTPSGLPRLILPSKTSKLEQSLNASSSICEVKDEEESTQNISMDLLPLFDGNTASLRNVKRANIILEMVKNLKIVSDTQIFKLRIYEKERKKLFSKKSLRKILHLLTSSGKIMKFERTGKVENEEKKFDFYCDTSVDEEGGDLQRALQYCLQKERTSLLASDAKAIEDTASSENIPILKLPPSTRSKPKFAKAKAMHQFLWYLVYGSEDIDTSDDQSQMDDMFMQSWPKHISPLTKLQDYPKGWCNICDVVNKMPLSIFLDIVHSISPEEVSGLEKYTSDTDRIHTTLNEIPVRIVRQLTKGRRYLFKCLQVCYILAKLGLLSFGKNDSVKKEETCMFVHTKASLINIPDCLQHSPLFSDIDETGRKMFYFDSLREVHDYWMAFQTTSLDVTAEPLPVERPNNNELKEKFKECLSGKTVDEINDDGRLPGDGLGPGGTDSTLFASLRRNWCLTLQAESFTFKGYTKKHPRIKKEKTLTIGNNIIGMNSKIVKVKIEKPLKRGSAPGTKQLKKRSSRSSKQKKKEYPSDDEFLEDNADGQTTAEVGEKALKAIKERLRRKRCYDEKDEEALKLMTRMRVSWSPEEDRMILLCILTNLFLANNFKWIIPSTYIREILHERIESSKVKTAQACLRRKNYLLKKEEVKKNILVYHSEALQNKDLCEEFRRGKKYTVSRMKDNETPFRECLALLERNFSQKESHSERTLVLPRTTNEFYDKFRITDPYCHLSTGLKEASTIQQVDFYSLQNLVHAIALLTDKIGRAHELYQLLSHFPKAVLSPVLKYMIAVGIFTKLKRYETKLVEKNATTGSYQLTQRYHYLFLVTYPKTIFKSTYDLYCSLPPRSDDPCHGSDFFSLSDTPASAALISTLMAQNKLQVETVVPSEIVVIQPTSAPDVQQSPIKKKTTRKRHASRVDDDDDDDEDDDDSDDSDFFEKIDSKNQTCTNSRTLLSWYRCQYTHSKTSKLIDLGNNLFINSCSVRIKLPPDHQTAIKPSAYVSWMNSVHAIDKVRDWNTSHTCIHPKTCSVLLKFMRRTYPESVDKEELLQQCIQLVDPSLSTLVRTIHDDIMTSTFVGKTIEDLLITFDNYSMEKITYLLRIMDALNLVLRVGVNCHRYVCFEHAKNWLIQVKKNLKGRGVIYKEKCQFNFEDFTIEKTLEEVECPLKDKTPNIVEEANNDEEDEDVELIIKHDNFTIKQRLAKKVEKMEDQQILESIVEKQTPLSPPRKVQKRVLESNSVNNVIQGKPKQKPLTSKRSSDSPNPRSAKKMKISQSEFLEMSDGKAASFSCNQQEMTECRSNETQIDFLIDQLSNSTHNDPNYAEHVSTRGQVNTNHYVSNKREADLSLCFPVKRQKSSDETLYTDFVQDPNFNFSSYLKESSTVLHNNPSLEFNNMGPSHLQGHHFMTNQHSNQMELGMSYSQHQQIGNNSNYPMFNDLNSGVNSGYMMPISTSSIPAKDIPMHVNGGGDGRIMFGQCLGKPLPQLDGATDDSACESDIFQNSKQPSVRTSDRLKNINKSVPLPSNSPSAKGTYKTVRILPRPWKTPEGTINRAALSSKLESICLFLLEHQGISREVFMTKYQNILQPIVLLEIIEILEVLGILRKTFLKKSHKPSLFSKRSSFIPTADCRGVATEVYFVTADCIIKMGQFLSQLHANKRTPDDAED